MPILLLAIPVELQVVIGLLLALGLYFAFFRRTRR
jgi:hypothetical protein